MKESNSVLLIVAGLTDMPLRFAFHSSKEKRPEVLQINKRKRAIDNREIPFHERKIGSESEHLFRWRSETI